MKIPMQIKHINTHIHTNIRIQKIIKQNNCRSKVEIEN